MLINVFVIELMLLIYSVLFILGNLLLLFIKFVLLVILINVFDELNRLISIKEKMILVSLSVNVLFKFILLMMLLILGGME